MNQDQELSATVGRLIEAYFPQLRRTVRKKPHPPDLRLSPAGAERSLWLWRAPSHLDRSRFAPRGEFQKQLQVAFTIAKVQVL
jgi:hypothetical protein